VPEQEGISPLIRRRYLLHSKVYKYDSRFRRMFVACPASDAAAHLRAREASALHPFIWLARTMPSGQAMRPWQRRSTEQ